MMFFIFLLVVVVSILSIKRIQRYWLRQGVLEIKPQFFTGNVLEIVTYRKSWGQLILEFYNVFKSQSVQYGGIYFFLKPTFIPLEPQLIKDILVNNFHSFVNRGLYYNKEYEPISANIVSLEDKTWKALRARLLPTFTTSQIKEMYRSFDTHTDNLKNSLLNYLRKNDSIDAHKLAANFTTDIAVRCLFGMASSCINDPQCKFSKQGKKITEITWQKSLTLILAQLFPRKLCGLLGMRFTDVGVEKFFLNEVRNTIAYREKHNITRKDPKDLVDILQSKHNKQEDKQSNNNQSENCYGVNEIAAQCFVGFIAGHETTATVLKFALYELAINPEVQNILRNNINAVVKTHNCELNYEAISEMEYLNGVVLETLRKHPVCPVLLRSCNKTYRVPQTDIILNKGTLVNIPILGLHMDPEYYSNPECFDPDRFSKENKKLIKDFTFLPFGGGPRKCLGYRFGILMVKAGIIEIIRNYEITICGNTKVPVELSPNSFFVTTKDKIWIKLNKIV